MSLVGCPDAVGMRLIARIGLMAAVFEPSGHAQVDQDDFFGVGDDGEFFSSSVEGLDVVAQAELSCVGVFERCSGGTVFDDVFSDELDVSDVLSEEVGFKTLLEVFDFGQLWQR